MIPIETPNINDYLLQKTCEYKGRTYLVRDNGAVCRLPKEDGRLSKWDNVWTFGKLRGDNGYMYLTGNITIHQIVCTAFHGAPDDPQLIVDHIDINHCNNRPENLRWITRLENILNNNITRAKVELICGSVEAFLENPSLLYGHESEDKNFSWMRAVSKAEAERSLKRWNEWAAKPKEERIPKGKGVGEFIFSDEDQDFVRSWNGGQLLPEQKTWAQQKAEIEAENPRRYEEEHSLKDSLTPGAKQLDWATPTEFPQIPQNLIATPLQDYLARLPKGAIYARNRWGDSSVYDAALAEDGSHLAVVTEITGVTNYALSEVTFENGFFVHKSIRTFFSEEGAQKYFTLSLGREWSGGDVLEDFC